MFVYLKAYINSHCHIACASSTNKWFVSLFSWPSCSYSVDQFFNVVCGGNNFSSLIVDKSPQLFLQFQWPISSVSVTYFFSFSYLLLWFYFPKIQKLLVMILSFLLWMYHKIDTWIFLLFQFIFQITERNSSNTKITFMES